ncbi:patatin-like phospholipase family protein [soil metagenome]
MDSSPDDIAPQEPAAAEGQARRDAAHVSPLARLFFGRRPVRGVNGFALPGGKRLFQPGDPADVFYMLRSGRLAVTRQPEGRAPQVLGIIRPGEPVVEMALIVGGDHSATAVALRDSWILALPRDLFMLEARRRPGVMGELASLAVTRSRQLLGAGSERGGSNAASEPSVFGLISLSPEAPARPLAERLAQRLRGEGRTVAVVGAEGLALTAEQGSALEDAHDIVLMAAESDEADWRAVCDRQVDQHMLIGRAGLRPPPSTPPHARAEEQRREGRSVDLVLLHPHDGLTGRDGQAWMDATGSQRLFHLRDGAPSDLSRLARVIAGTSVGLVLSGGGARAYAHIGAIRALREAGQPIDFIGGASMGAIIGAGVAMGWDDRELDERMRASFVDSSPVGDISFPMIAMSGGKRVRMRLREQFGEREFADLELPFFCVSSNLTTGLPRVHRTGRIHRALRASSALPGVLPPVIEEGDVLVDGGILRNLPTDVMRETQRGPVIGIDVALTDELNADDVARPPSLWRWVASGQWRKGPPIVALLIRSATVTTHREFAAAREASDLLVTPMIEGVDLQDWKAYAPAVEAGYRAMNEALEGLDMPLTELRHRPPTPM